MKSKTRSQSSARSPGIKATDKAPKVENSPEPSPKPKDVRVFGPASVPRDELANKSPEEKRSAYDGDTAFKLYLREIARLIDDTISSVKDEGTIHRVRGEIREMCGRFPLYEEYARAAD